VAHPLRDDIGARTEDAETPSQLSLRHHQHEAATYSKAQILKQLHGPIRTKKKAVS
jgi:hypothetical protein